MNIAILTRWAGLVAASLALVAAPVSAQQIETVDPNLVIDGDLEGETTTPQVPADTGDGWIAPEYDTSPESPDTPSPSLELPSSRYDSLPQDDTTTAPPATTGPATTGANQDTYAEDDLIGAAEGLFGKGAEGLARLIEDILAKQGQPNGYIVGREGGGAFIVGVRYGSGTLHHRIEGNKPVYWTGPSIGLDAGANAANTFVLVYNLYDSEDLFERFPAGEGQAYFVGGFNVSYLRRGDIVLIPIRVGAGLRLGINAGYMRFSHKQRWLPF
ncbi:DUF1134 domain-containing protein [Aurantiacibacter suaedae]|uniref:DUF1134 domain-containing protein n=1 Tax=Aurantiacibacter suaedae TaxID=2545755 RepID=UPI0010F5EBE7|nr:DUF1134 domain-containing protein [Aurantiacibacter suaedae]